MDFFMMLKRITGRLSILYFVLCWVVFHQSSAAPVRCSTSRNAEDALRTIASNYIVVESSPPKFVLSNGEQPSSTSKLPWQCHYSFVETKKNPNQIPSSLVTAKCKKDYFGMCHPRCHPRIYYVTVLEKDPDCNERIGQTVWRTKQVPIITGYDKLFWKTILIFSYWIWDKIAERGDGRTWRNLP